MASGPGTRAHVVTGVRAARHEQPRSVAARGARSRTPGARASGSRGRAEPSWLLPWVNAQGFRVIAPEVPGRDGLSGRGGSGSIASVIPRPSGLAIGDRVRPRRPNLGRPLWGLTRPARCSPPWRHRDPVVGYGQGIPGPPRSTRVFALQAAGREPSTYRLDLVGEVFPRPGQSLDGRFSGEIDDPSRRLFRSSTCLPAYGVTRRHCLLHRAVLVAPPSVRPDHSGEGTPLLA